MTLKKMLERNAPEWVFCNPRDAGRVEEAWGQKPTSTYVVGEGQLLFLWGVKAVPVCCCAAPQPSYSTAEIPDEP